MVYATEEIIQEGRSWQVEFLKPKEKKSIKTWYNLKFVYLDDTSEDIVVRDRASAADQYNVAGTILRQTNRGEVYIYKSNKAGCPSPGTLVYSTAEDKQPTQDVIDAAKAEWKFIEARRGSQNAPIKKLVHKYKEESKTVSTLEGAMDDELMWL